MKTKSLIATLMLGMTLAARAALLTYSFTSGFQNSGNVPDGSLSGWTDTRTLSGIGENQIADVNVRLNMSGGWNGDLYVYLTHSSGMSVLFNRVGVTTGNSSGYGNSGFNITLDDQASQTTDIHNYQTVSGYSLSDSIWRPDARNIDPLSSGTAFDAANRTALLSVFNGFDPNGSWTLFIADVKSGEQSQLISWELDIVTAVPEPTNVALEIFALVCLGAWAGSRRHKFLRTKRAWVR